MVSVTAIVIGVGLVVLFFSGIRIIRPTERGLVETLGKYSKFIESGFNWIVPVIQRTIQVNITEKLAEVDPQVIITKDRLNAHIDAQIYYKIKSDEQSVKNSQYQVYSVNHQIVQLARTTLRNIIGNLSLEDANSKRNEINKNLMDELTKQTKTWGVEIVRAELKEINPPKDVQEIMNKVVIAENEKKAAIDFATAVETRADGEKRAAIKTAEGLAKSITIEADAKATAIKVVNESAEKYFKGNAQKLKQYEVTQASLQNNTKVVLTEKGINPVIVLGSDTVVPVKVK